MFSISASPPSRKAQVLPPINNERFTKYSPPPNNSKNVVAAFGFTGAFLLVTSIIILIAAIASLIIPFIAVAASLLVIGIITVTVIAKNKKLYDLFFHVLGVCKFRIDLKENKLENCNLLKQPLGFQTENKKEPKKYANTMFVTPNRSALTLMATPDEEKVKWLSNNNYKSIISMQEKWEESDPSLDFQSATPALVKYDSKENIRYGKFVNPKNSTKTLPIIQYQVATPDCLNINFKNLDTAVELVKSGLEKGNVAVHCKSGIGRSAKVIASYFHKHQDLSIEEAVKRVRDGRRVVSIHKINELPNLYEYAVDLLKENLKNNDYSLDIQLDKILTLKSQMDNHIKNYYTEMGKKSGDTLKQKLETLYEESGLKYRALGIQFKKIIASRKFAK